MSTKSTGEWLLSHNKYSAHESLKELERDSKKLKRNAYTISITSGKGGVGKTSFTLKMGKELAARGYKVLVIDCDTNLSNTSVKLGIPLNRNFVDFKNEKMSFENSLYRDGKFHLFSACNGDIELFEEGVKIDQLIIQVLVAQERNYDYILLDCPAGLTKDTLALNAYSDYRFFIVTPDKSSITDSYSLMKILTQKFGVTSNHLVVNRVSHKAQYSRIVRTLSETVENFLGARLRVLGGLSQELMEVDKFDGLLLENAGCRFHRNFLQVLNRFTEESDGTVLETGSEDTPFVRGKSMEQEVQLTVS